MFTAKRRGTSSNIRKTSLPLRALVLASVGFSGAAMAQGNVPGTIITGIAIDTHDANMAFISAKLPKRDNPACSTSSWAFVLPLNTPLQNLMFSQLMEARVNNWPVSLSGSGTCDTYPDLETLTFIFY